MEHWSQVKVEKEGKVSGTEKAENGKPDDAISR